MSFIDLGNWLLQIHREIFLSISGVSPTRSCAVKVHEFAHGVGINNAVQIGDQTNIVGRDVLGEVNLRGGFSRGDKTATASNARDVKLEFFRIVRKLHELGAEHALFGAAIGLHDKVVLGGFAPLAKLDGKEGLGVVLFRAKGHAVIAFIAALPHKAVPGLVFQGFDGFLEVHTHVHLGGAMALCPEKDYAKAFFTIQLGQWSEPAQHDFTVKSDGRTEKGVFRAKLMSALDLRR